MTKEKLSIWFIYSTFGLFINTHSVLGEQEDCQEIEVADERNL